MVCVSAYYPNFLDKGIGLFNGFFHGTAITHIFHIFIFLISSLILQLNGFFPRKIWSEHYSSLFSLLVYKFVYYNSFILNKLLEQFRILEYPLIILFVIIGGAFLISSSDLISIFLSIELQSYGLYILCTIYRNSERATSGGLTYFLLGALSSCFILLASSLLYGNSGNTSFDGLFVINNISSFKENLNETIQTWLIYWYESYYISSSLVILSIGFLFKISAAPFHFWSPDVYDAIPSVVTTFVAIFAKISILILLLELVHYTNSFFNSEGLPSELTFQTENDILELKQEQEINKISLFNFSWTYTLLISSLLSLIIGAVLGLTQFRIKRLYAYSTISHIGFILLALTINSIESIQSFIFYLMQYSLANLNAFFLLVSIGYSFYFYTARTVKNKKNKLESSFDLSEEKKENSTIVKQDKESNTSDEIKDEYALPGQSVITDKKNSPLQLISQIKGYFYINPVLSISLALTLFSFAGIPPLIGFFAKQMVLSSALDNGYVFITLIAILTSVISAYYYLALVKQMFFYETDYELNPQIKNITMKGNIFSKTNNRTIKNITVSVKNISLSSSLSVTIAILTLIILFFILAPQEWLTLANILALILFNC